MKEHVRKSWETYREQVVPADASVTQVTESRLAFFAGATALFHKLTSPPSIGGILTEGPDDAPESMAAMRDVQLELDAFARELEIKVLKARTT